MAEVELLVNTKTKNGFVYAGTVIELDDESAENAVKNGVARFVDIEVESAEDDKHDHVEADENEGGEDEDVEVDLDDLLNVGPAKKTRKKAGK